MRADRSAAGDHDQRCVCRFLDRPDQCIGIVGHRAGCRGLTAGFARHLRQHGAVYRRYLRGRAILRIGAKLIPGFDDGHVRPFIRDDLGQAARSGERDLRRAHPGAHLEQRVARPEIETGAADEPGGWRCAGGQVGSIDLRVFLHQHRIRPQRHLRAGGNAHSLTLAQHLVVRGARARFPLYPPRPFAAGRVAIHGGQIDRGLAAPRDGRFGEEAPGALVDRNGGRSAGAEHGQQPRLRFFEVQPCAHPARSSACQSPDLPPVLDSRRTSSTTMPLSSAFAMS